MEETSSSSSHAPLFLPDDLALHIVSFLEVCILSLCCFFPNFILLFSIQKLRLLLVSCGDDWGWEKARDVCSLACGARFWRDLCASDFVWIALYKRRWPSDDPGLLASSQQGPRLLYISKHQKIAVATAAIIEFVKQLAQKGSLEVGYYLKAVNDLRAIDLGFEDVQIFLLGNKHDVLLNLIGIHYCLFQLDIQPDDLMSVLQNSNVAERQVCVSWFKVGRWFYGFRLPDEHRSRILSLRDLAMGKEDDVMRLLNRGAVHEVLRVHITSATTSTR